MKRAFTGILIGCMLVFTGGYQLITTCYRIGLRAEMKNYLRNNPHSRLATVFFFHTEKNQIRENGFEWEEEGDEFSYKNVLYDVVSVEYRNGQAIIHCINDANETRLVQFAESLERKKQDPANDTRLAFQKLMQINLELLPEQTTVNFFVQKNKYFPVFESSPTQIVLDIIPPPPQYPAA
ncbi:MAG: hypothetical protein RLZZ28_2178 [Bacteroidota bacterium]|jgi:hypothetical protein